MSVMSIRIDDSKRKILKIIASIENKTMSGLVEELLDEYIKTHRDRLATLLEKEDLLDAMKLSEPTFMEWDNKEDEIYDNL